MLFVVLFGLSPVAPAAGAEPRTPLEWLTRSSWFSGTFDPADLPVAGTLFKEKPAEHVLWFETWSGADVASDTWLLYTGATVAPFSAIHDNGLRFRFAGGYGGYQFQDRRAGAGLVPQPFKAQTYYTDLLVGYLHRLGPLTAKAFVGASAIDHQAGPGVPLNAVTGLEIGPKAVVEFWLNIGERGWASLDVAYTTAHHTGSLRTRAGYRITPKLSLGIEAGANINAENEGGRVGLFARYDWRGGEISISAGASNGGPLGLSGDMIDGASPYATINWLTHF